MVDLNDDSINLRALRKIDNQIGEILFSAGQVAIYYYNIDEVSGAETNGGEGPDGDGKWQRKEIEGALFFVRRTSQPEYAFVVINKLNTINLVQKITKDLETSVQLPYLMYKNTESEIYCVWFYDKDQCVILNQKIIEVIEKMKKEPLPHLMNNFNGINSGQIHPAQADILKKILSMDNKNSVNVLGLEMETQKLQISKPVVSINPSTAELVKPVAQRRSVNLKDLFESTITAKVPAAAAAAAATRSAVEKPSPMMKTSMMNHEPIVKGNLPTENITSCPDTNSNSVHKGKDSEHPLYLTMEQLKKSLVYLLQNDADFLHSIHTTYVEVIKK